MVTENRIKIDLILPEEIYDTIWHIIESKIKLAQYSRVFLPLSSLLEGDFFNDYIKSGVSIPSLIVCAAEH